MSGVPRMTRQRKRKNTGDRGGFTVVDPGGNWIRIFPTPEAGTSKTMDAESSRLARTLDNAIVLGESKGDHRRAARILDGAPTRE